MKLEEWRDEIDTVDVQIMNLINQRIRIARKIGVLKAKTGVAIIDSKREEQILQTAREMDLKPLERTLLVGIYRKIINESRRVQTQISPKNNERGVKTY